MALGTRSTGTFEDILMKMLQDLAVAKTMPDADLNLVVQLETMIIQALRAPHDQLAALQAQQGGQGGMPPAGALPPGGNAGAGLPPQLAAALAQLGGGGPGGGGPGIPPGGGGPPAVAGLRNAGPNPDDLARILGGGGSGVGQ